MKLLFCPECHDIVKLDYDKRSCKCGESFGYYHADGSHATVCDKAVVIGLDNITLARAFRNMRDLPELAQPAAMELGNFRAWVFHRKHSPRITYT